MKFICDDNLGKLAKWLRTLGCDTLFSQTISDKELISVALSEDRIILTRDTKLVQLKSVTKYLLIESDKPLEQLKQVKEKFNLKIDEQYLFSRCLVCNTLLEKIEKESIKEKIPPYVYKNQNDFVHCPQCDKIFWPGTHVQRMTQRLKDSQILE
jgi:uncharacterized protein